MTRKPHAGTKANRRSALNLPGLVTTLCILLIVHNQHFLIGVVIIVSTRWSCNRRIEGIVDTWREFEVEAVLRHKVGTACDSVSQTLPYFFGCCLFPSSSQIVNIDIPKYLDTLRP